MMKNETISFSDTRKQLHWASQLLSAAADATLPSREDDSHSNLGWNAETRQLEGRADCWIDVPSFRLHHGQDSLALSGDTLDSARQWLASSIGHELVFRDYEMPAHSVSQGSQFSPDETQLASIADWLTFAQQILSPQGSLRLWPHHFDLGFWNAGNVDGRSIGGGFSLGDPHYDQPYFYMNPYGVDQPKELPKLPVGHWSEHWFGAVLLEDEMQHGTLSKSEHSKSFVESAYAACLSLTTEEN